MRLIDLPPGTPVVLYGRTSGDRQKKEETIRTQIGALETECDRIGLNVVGVYRDNGVPNWVPLEDRPDGKRLLTDAEKGGFEAVLVYKSGRLARDPIVFHHNRRLLGRLGVTVFYLTEDLDFETPEGRFTSGIKLLVNDYEKDSQGDLMLRGKYRIADEGFYTGGVVDFGYRVEMEGKRGRYVPCPVEAPQVERIYRLHVCDRQSARQIAILLTAEGVPTATMRPENGYRGHRVNRKDHGVWSPQMVAKLLRKPIYKGLKPYGGGKQEQVFQRVPALVPVDLWDAAQARLDEGKSLSVRNTKNEYLLARKIRCAVCGSLFTGREVWKGPRQYFYYECGEHRASNHPHRPSAPCVPVTRFQCGWVDEDCWRELLVLISDGDNTLARIREQWVSQDEHLQQLEGRRSRRLTERAALEDERLQAKRGKSRLGFDLTAKEARTLLDQLEPAILQAERDVETLTAQMAQVTNREGRLERAEQNLRYWASRLTDTLSFHARRHLVELFVEAVEVRWENETIVFDYYFIFDPETFTPDEEGSKGGEAVSTLCHTFTRMEQSCTLALLGRAVPTAAAPSAPRG